MCSGIGNPPSRYGLFGVTLRRVTIAIGLCSVRLATEGRDPACIRFILYPVQPTDKKPGPVTSLCGKLLREVRDGADNLLWRDVQDSNLRAISDRRFSKPLHSTTLPTSHMVAGAS